MLCISIWPFDACKPSKCVVSEVCHTLLRFCAGGHLCEWLLVAVMVGALGWVAGCGVPPVGPQLSFFPCVLPLICPLSLGAYIIVVARVASALYAPMRHCTSLFLCTGLLPMHCMRYVCYTGSSRAQNNHFVLLGHAGGLVTLKEVSDAKLVANHALEHN